jgi:hypothetical protein
MKTSDLPSITPSHVAYLRTTENQVLGKVNRLWTILPTWHRVALQMHNNGLSEMPYSIGFDRVDRILSKLPNS